jgi:hypothetical protein
MKAIVQLFDDVPGLQLLCVGFDAKSVASKLQEALDATDGSVDLYEFENQIDTQIVLPNRKYEACVVYNVDCNDADFLPLLHKIYDSLETTATVVFLNEGEKNYLYDLQSILEEGRLQNANSIDLVDNHSLVVAKKLQMWV